MVSLGDDRLRLHQLCSDAQQCVDIRQQWQCGWSTMVAMCMGGRQRRQCGWSIVWAVWVVDSGCSVGGPLQWPFWWSVLVAVWWSTACSGCICAWSIVVNVQVVDRGGYRIVVHSSNHPPSHSSIYLFIRSLIHPFSHPAYLFSAA